MYKALQNFGENSTVVVVGEQLWDVLPKFWDTSWQQAVVITDSHTQNLWEPYCRHILEYMHIPALYLSFPAGEEHKTREIKAYLEDCMLKAHITRKACVIGIGGGIVTDLSGFIAATYMRGIAHIFFPTTLVAQVDAAHGGKTAVNTPHGKNLIGAFHLPKLVLCDTKTLTTLPFYELKNGFAECLKHAIIASEELFKKIEQKALERDYSIFFLPDFIFAHTQIKYQIIEEDLLETGKRKILNFGHTIGHALEMASEYALSHGEAVALGMLVELRIAERVTGFPHESYQRIRHCIQNLQLPVSSSMPFQALMSYLFSDKKNENTEVHCALPQHIGVMESFNERWSTPVPLEVIEWAWNSSVASESLS